MPASSGGQFSSVRNIAGAKRAHIGVRESQQRNCVPVVADEFDFEGFSLAMHQHSGAHIAALQAMFR